MPRLSAKQCCQIPSSKRAKKRQDELWIVLQIVNQVPTLIKRPAKGIGRTVRTANRSEFKELGSDMNLNTVEEAELLAMYLTFSHFKVRLEHYRLKIGEDQIQVSDGRWLSYFKRGSLPLSKGC